MKQYFLIKEWLPHRKNSPAYCFYGSVIYPLPLTGVNPNFVYTNRKRAEKIAEKHNTLWTRAEVIEVPSELIQEHAVHY